MHGARAGTVKKVQEVRDPGYMSKLLMNSTMHQLISEHDCGTTKGIALDAASRQVHDRHLQQDFTSGNLHIPADTMLSPDVVGKILAAKKDAKVIVRSPLRCESEKGICQKCYGLDSGGNHPDIGTNVGVRATQALGERAVQLSMKAFHTGGAGGGSRLLNSFGRLEQILSMPEKIPDEAALAMKSGKIEDIKHTATGADIIIGGVKHHVGKDIAGRLLYQPLPHAETIPGYKPWNAPKVGMQVEAGDHLSDPNRTIMNPHRLYEATGSLEKVQNHIANEAHKLYEEEGVKRREVETVVKSISDLTKIDDPGDEEHLLRGEFRSLAAVNKMNRELIKQGKQPIEHTPTLAGIKVLPLELQEDWMAKLQHENLKSTLLDAAASGAVSHIHGAHPVPSIAYGAEFGLTKKDSLKPGYEHLRDVPEHHY
jgi:DNA-directed RNA polymerase subunit beta'